MKPEIIRRLLDLNRSFYEDFGSAFAATRHRIQPGIRRILLSFPMEGNWLDLGCGSGALALEWTRHAREGHYWGLDSSSTLLTEAAKAVSGIPQAQGIRLRFSLCDLAGLDFPPASTDGEGFLPPIGIFCFAVLHHLPSAELRHAVIRRASLLLPTGGVFIHSEWQFMNSPRLVARIQSWEQLGLSSDDLEDGDTLLDWRYSLTGQPTVNGLRYVHRISPVELSRLAEDNGFLIRDEFESDGEGGRLGFYQVWEKR